MTKRYKKAVLIGRFEPAHNGHLRNFVHAASIADTVQILIGSASEPRTIKNPFTAMERQRMIISVLQDAGLDETKFTFSYVSDYSYNDNMWIQSVQNAVNENGHEKDDDIVILGHEKDESSWYLRAFPTWDFLPIGGFVEHGSQAIDATKIRELYFEGHLDFLQGAVPPSVFTYLKKFSACADFATLVEEYKFIQNYKAAWAGSPYPPTFFTVDSVVIQGGYILLIKRKFAPGKGLWALPGGFINPKETARKGAVRELHEETGLKVPEAVLNGSITYEKLFDKPDRSLRGRTITQAFLFELASGDTKLPKVKGQDDAVKAKWWPISTVLAMSDQMFDDHYSIIQTMVARAK